MRLVSFVSPYAEQNWPLQHMTFGGNGICGDTLLRSCPDNHAQGDWMVSIVPVAKNIRTRIPKHRRVLLAIEPPDVCQTTPEMTQHFGWIITSLALSKEVVGTARVITGFPLLGWWYGIPVHIGAQGHQPGTQVMNLDDILQEPLPQKQRLASIITSNKKLTEMHRKRIRFVQALKEILGDQVDVFGFGFNPIPDKRDALRPYHVHFALENLIHPHYWTEKLADPIIAGCRVLYAGDPLIHQCFHPDVVSPISMDDPEGTAHALQKVLNTPIPPNRIQEERVKMLLRYNPGYIYDKLFHQFEQWEKTQFQNIPQHLRLLDLI